jgi:hypothetical protein
MKMETPGSSETLTAIYQNARRHIPEDRNLIFTTVATSTLAETCKCLKEENTGRF